MNTAVNVQHAPLSNRKGPDSNSDLQALSESFDQSTEHVPLMRRGGNPRNDVIIKGILKGGKSYNIPRDVNDDVNAAHRQQTGNTRDEGKRTHLTAPDSDIHFISLSDRHSHQSRIKDVIATGTSTITTHATISSSKSNSSHNSNSTGNSHEGINTSSNNNKIKNQKRDIIIPAPSRKYTTTNPGTLSPIYHLIYDLTSPTSPASIDTNTSCSLPSSASSKTFTNHHTNETHTTSITTIASNSNHENHKPATSTIHQDFQRNHLHHHPRHESNDHHHNQTTLNTDVNQVNAEPKITVGQFLTRDRSQATATGTVCQNPPLHTGKQEQQPLPPLPPRSSTLASSSSSFVPRSHFVNQNSTNLNQRNSNYRTEQGNRATEGERDSNGKTERGEKLDAPKASDIDTFAATTEGNVNLRGPHSSISSFHNQHQPPPHVNYTGNNISNGNCINNIYPHKLDSVSNSSNKRLDSSSACHSNVNPTITRVHSKEDTKLSWSGIGRLVGDAGTARNNRDAIFNKSSSGVNEVFTVSSLVSSNNEVSVHDKQKTILHRDANDVFLPSSHLTANNNQNNTDSHHNSSDRVCSNLDQENCKNSVPSDSCGGGYNLSTDGCDDNTIAIDSTQTLGYQSVNSHAANSVCDKDLTPLRGSHSDPINARGFVDSDSGIAYRESPGVCVAKSDGDFSGSGVKGVGIIKATEDKANSSVGRNRNGKRPAIATCVNSDINGDPKRAVFKRDGDSVRLFLVKDHDDTHCTSPARNEEFTSRNNSQSEVTSHANTSVVGIKENGKISNKVKRKHSWLSPSGVVSKLNQKNKDKKKDRKQQQKVDNRKNSNATSIGENSVGGNIKKSPVNRWEKIHVNHTKHSVSSLSSELENGRQIFPSVSSASSDQQQHHHHQPHQPPQQQQQQNASLLTLPSDVTCGLVSAFNNGIWTGEQLPACANTNATACPVPASKPAIRGILVNKGNRPILQSEEVGGESGGGGQSKHKDRGSLQSSQKQNGVHFFDDTIIPSFALISHSNTGNNNIDKLNLSNSTVSPNTQRREVIDRNKYIIKSNKSTSSFLSKSFDDALQVFDNPVTSPDSKNAEVNRQIINKKAVQNTPPLLAPRGGLTKEETSFITDDRYTILSSSKSVIPQHSLSSTTTLTSGLYLDQQGNSVGNSNKINITSYTGPMSPCSGRGSQSQRFEDLAHTPTQGRNGVSHHPDDGQFAVNSNHTQRGAPAKPRRQGLPIKRGGETRIQHDYNHPDAITITSTQGTFRDQCGFGDKEKQFPGASVGMVNGVEDNPVIDPQWRLPRKGDYMPSNPTMTPNPTTSNFDADRSTGRYDHEEAEERKILEDSETLKYSAQLKEAGRKSTLRQLYGADHQHQSTEIVECDSIDFSVRRRQEIDNCPDVDAATSGVHSYSHNGLDAHDYGLQDSATGMTTSLEKQLPPKITPRQKFEILHNRVSKKVATSLRHNNPNTNNSQEHGKQTEHSHITDSQTGPGTSENLNDCVILKHDTLHHSTNSLYKESPRARFERDRAARAHAVAVTNTTPNADNIFYHPCDTDGTSAKFNKSCDDLDTSTFGYLKPTHSRTHSSETGTIPYLDAQYSALPSLQTRPPRPAPRQSLQNRNYADGNPNEMNASYSQANTDIGYNNEYHQEINPNNVSNKIGDDFHTNSTVNSFNGNNYLLLPKPAVPPRSSKTLDKRGNRSKNSNTDNNKTGDIANKDFTTTGTFHVDIPLPVHYNTAHPCQALPEQRIHDNLKPLRPDLLRSPQSSEVVSVRREAVAPNKTGLGVRQKKQIPDIDLDLINTNNFHDIQNYGVNNKSINSVFVSEEEKEKERSKFLITSYNNISNHYNQISLQQEGSLSISDSISTSTTAVITPFPNNNNIDISSPPSSSSGVSTIVTGVATTNNTTSSLSGEGSERTRISGATRSDANAITDRVGNGYNYYTKSHSTLVSSHQRVNRDLQGLQLQTYSDKPTRLQSDSATSTSSISYNNNRNSSNSYVHEDSVKSVSSASYDNGNHSREKVNNSECGPSIYSPIVNNNSISDNVNKSRSESDPCGDLGGGNNLLPKDKENTRVLEGQSSSNIKTNSNNPQCSCTGSSEPCPLHRHQSCLEVPALLRASATKKMSPDSVSSSGYESEHPVSGIRFLKGEQNLDQIIADKDIQNCSRSFNYNHFTFDYNNDKNNRSTVQELRLRFGHSNNKTSNIDNHNKENDLRLKVADRVVNHRKLSGTACFDKNIEIIRDRHNSILPSDAKYDISTSPRPIGHANNGFNHDINNRDYSGGNRPRNSSDPQQNTGRTVRLSPSSNSCGSQNKQIIPDKVGGYHQQPHKTLDNVSRSMRDIIHDLNVESPGSKYNKGKDNKGFKSNASKQSPTQFVSISNVRNSGDSSASENTSNSFRRNLSNDCIRNIPSLAHSYSCSDNIHITNSENRHTRNFVDLPNSISLRRTITYQEAAMLASKGLRIYEDSGDYLLPIQDRKPSLAKTLSEPKVSWEAASYLIVPTVVESFNNANDVSNFVSASGDIQPSSVLDILTQRSISDSGATKPEINNGAHSDGDVCSSDNEYIAMSRSPSAKMRARAMSVDLICKDATSENSQDVCKETVLNPNVAKVTTRIKRKDRRPSRGYVEWKTCSGWIGGVDMRNMSKRNSRGYVEWDTIWTPASSTKGDAGDDEHVYDVIQDEQPALASVSTETTLTVSNSEELTIPQIVTSSDDSDVPPALPERTYINKLKQHEDTSNSHHRLCPRHSPHSHHHPHQHSHHHSQPHQHSTSSSGSHQHHPHQSHRHHHRHHSNSPSSSNRRHHHHHHSHHHHSSPHSHHHHRHHHNLKDSNSSLSSSSSTITSSKLKSSNKPPPGERHPPPPPIPPPTHSPPPPPLPPPNPPPPHSSTFPSLPSTHTTPTTTTTPDTSQNYAQVSKLKGYTFGNLMSHDATHMTSSHHHQHNHDPKSSAIYSENYCHLQPLTSEDRMTLWKPADVLDYIDGLHETMSPGRRENIYILLNNKKTRAKFSESLEIESRLLSKGLLGACVSKFDIDASALPDSENNGDVSMDSNNGRSPAAAGLACGAVAAPEVKKRTRVPVSSTYV